MPHTMKRSPLVIVPHSSLHHTLDIFLSLGFTKFPEFWSTYYLITCTFIVYILILIMLCYWHYSICHILFNREALLRDNTIVTRYRRQVAQLLIALIITFFILILPYKIWAIIHQNITYEQFLEIGFHRHSLLSTITRALLYLNSAVNPFLSEEINQELFYLLVSSFYRSIHCSIQFSRRNSVRVFFDSVVDVKHHRKFNEHQLHSLAKDIPNDLLH